MKWKLRVFILIFSSISLFTLCSCSQIKIRNYINSSEDVYTTSTQAEISDNISTTFSTTTEEPTSLTTTEIIVSEIEEQNPIRFQGDIELNIKNQSFLISTSLIQKLDYITQSHPNTIISWGLYSLSDEAYIASGKETEFISCSTIKVVYSLYVLEQVKSGYASLDDILVYNWNKHHYHSNTASTSTIATLGKTEFTLKEIIYYTLHVSDNDAYMMLLDYFGIDGFNQYMTKLGSKTELSSSMLYGQATVQSRATEWKQIYSFYNENNEISRFLKDTLINAKYAYIEQGLTKLGYETAHKSGWSTKYGAAHDCAIVYSPNGEYIMIVLTYNWNQSPQKQLVTEIAPVLAEIWDEYLKNQ